MQMPITLLSQWFFLCENQTKTPTILKSGSQPPREDHFTLAPGGNIGREEETLYYIAVYLLLTVHNGVPSEENT